LIRDYSFRTSIGFMVYLVCHGRATKVCQTLRRTLLNGFFVISSILFFQLKSEAELLIKKSYLMGGQLYMEVFIPEDNTTGNLLSDEDDPLIEFFNSDLKALVAERQKNVLSPQVVNKSTGQLDNLKAPAKRSMKRDMGKRKLINGMPALNATRVGQSFEILWTAEFSGERWRLEYAELDSPTSTDRLLWRPVETHPQIRKRWFVHKIDTSSEVKFYRLSLNPNQNLGY